MAENLINSIRESINNFRIHHRIANNNLFQDVKYSYDDYMYSPKVLSDSLARFLGNYSKDVVAVYLNLTRDNTSEKFFLKKFYYCVKNNVFIDNENCFNLLRHCSRNPDRNSILSVERKMFLLRQLRLRHTWNNEVLEWELPFLEDLMRHDPPNDNDFMLGITNYFENENNRELLNRVLNDEYGADYRRLVIKKLRTAIILIFDFLILPHVFNNIISNDDLNQNDIVEYVENVNPRILHPDSVLTKHITTHIFERPNNYVGLSFMCCVLCSTYLEAHECTFRGLSNTFYDNWATPDSDNEREEFRIKLDILRETIENRRLIPPPIIINHNHIVDENHITLDKFSDDICFISNYLCNLNYDLIITEFDRNTIQSLTNLRNMLIGGHNCERCAQAANRVLA